jgi:hypothetical protein
LTDPTSAAHLDRLLARGDALVQPFEPVEPELFLTLAPDAARRYASVLIARLTEVVSQMRR